MGKSGSSGGGSVRRSGHYTMSPADYRLMEQVGYGASATVYRAIFLPANEVVAVKCLDLDRCNGNLCDQARSGSNSRKLPHDKPGHLESVCNLLPLVKILRLRGLLVKEPPQRLAYRRGATEFKQHPFFQSLNWALIRCACSPEIPRPYNRKNGDHLVARQRWRRRLSQGCLHPSRTSCSASFSVGLCSEPYWKLSSDFPTLILLRGPESL